MDISVAVKQYDNIQLTTLINVFTHYQSHDWSCWLDSGRVENTQSTVNQNIQATGYKRSHNNRYHILVHSPQLTFEFNAGKACVAGSWVESPPNDKVKTLIDNCKRQVSELNCPFDMLNKLHTLFQKCINVNDLRQRSHPFIVGALGSFGYDLNVFLNDIKDNDENEFDLSDICIGYYSNSIIYDAQLKQLFVYYQSDNESYVKHVDTILNKSVDTAKFELTESWHSNMQKHDYTYQIKRIHDYLKAGDCYQVNFAQRFSATYQGDEFQAYLQLRDINNAPFSAFMRYKSSAILSLSPERFLSINNKVVETKPIKGTRKRSTDPEVDLKMSTELLNSEKDKAENLMIVDLLRNDLSKYCEPHSVSVPDLFKLESYPAVHHMVSTVTGKLKQNATPYDLLKGAFPGGSITGAPKIRAMQVIQELEPNKRSIYCGSIGYIGIKDDMDTNICIRTLLAERGQLHCWAGGGIVFDSIAEDEYQESLDKVNKILPILENEQSK